MSEVWLPVLGFEYLYEVSSLGRVRSFDRITRAGRGDGGRLVRGRELRLNFNRRRGYFQISLHHRDGIELTVYVHKVVCEAFHGPKPPGRQCRHLDGNKRNNSAANLTWGTPCENMADKKRHGTEKTGRFPGEANQKAKLSVSEVSEMRAMFASGAVTQKQLAAEYAVSTATVNRVIRRNGWRHVP